MPIHYQYIFHLSSYHVFHSNVVLVHQTSKRKRVISEPEGAPARSLENVVVPEKSDSAPLILAVQPVTQNAGPTPADISGVMSDFSGTTTFFKDFAGAPSGSAITLFLFDV